MSDLATLSRRLFEKVHGKEGGSDVQTWGPLRSGRTSMLLSVHETKSGKLKGRLTDNRGTDSEVECDCDGGLETEKCVVECLEKLAVKHFGELTFVLSEPFGAADEAQRPHEESDDRFAAKSFEAFLDACEDALPDKPGFVRLARVRGDGESAGWMSWDTGDDKVDDAYNYALGKHAPRLAFERAWVRALLLFLYEIEFE